MMTTEIFKIMGLSKYNTYNMSHVDLSIFFIKLITAITMPYRLLRSFIWFCKILYCFQKGFHCLFLFGHIEKGKGFLLAQWFQIFSHHLWKQVVCWISLFHFITGEEFQKYITVLGIVFLYVQCINKSWEKVKILWSKWNPPAILC